MPLERARDRRTHRAVGGFDRSARAYERGRPDYPIDAVRYLARALRIGPGRTLVELGSGTGKFTRGLRAFGAAIVAIEPTRGMREEFARQLPDLPVVDGTAERIPVPNGFADAVVAAQAFHWFRVRPARAEIARVLRPGGGLGLVWNTRDERIPWMRAFSEIVHRYDAGNVWKGRNDWRRAFDTPDNGFGPIHHRAFPHVQRTDVPGAIDRALSVSVVALQPPGERRRIAAEIREVLSRDPTTRGRRYVDLPYRTDVYWCRRAG